MNVLTFAQFEHQGNLMTSHYDALGVAVVLLTLAYLNRRAYKRTLKRVRAQRDNTRAECAMVREQLYMARGDLRLLRALEPAVTAADALNVDEPIPYGVGPDPYAPVWTSGPLLDDGATAHREFGDVVRARFGTEAS